MTLNDLRLGIVKAAFWAQARWPLMIVVLGLVLFAIVAASVRGCRERSFDRKVETQREAVIGGRIEANIAANEVRKNEENTNLAGSDLDRALRRDSREFSGANADDRFCRRYPNDSTCAEWRRLRPTP